jgi:hypothetical protein
MSQFYTSQICEKGHLVSYDVNDHRSNFCDKCGSKTFTNCEKCSSPIHGSIVGDYLSSGEEIRNYCYNCGVPYPWTVYKISRISELLRELEGLKPDERNNLEKSVPDLIELNTGTGLAVIRFKKTLAHLQPAAAEILKNVISQVASQAVLHSFGLQEKPSTSL